MTAICHMTHLHNLPGILHEGGLWCDREAAERGLVQQGIAHDHIKQRRTRRAVTIGPGGFLCDYVPFYFWYHSPMLYVINNSGVSGYGGGQSDVIYLVSNIAAVQEHRLRFVFTDGHAEMALSQQFLNPADLERLDWKMIREKQWADTNADNDRKRRKQAEFLVHNFFPWGCVTQIGAFDEAAAARVQAILNNGDDQVHKPSVHVRSSWYY